MTTGFVSRSKGKVYATSASVQQAGKGVATTAGGGNIYASAGPSGTPASTVETTLASFSLPSNSLDIVGRNILITAFGSFAANANNKTLKLYFGGSIVMSSGVVAQNGGGWWMNINLLKSGSNTQLANGQFIIGSTHNGCLSFSGTEVDTAAILLKLTGTNGTASANDLVLQSFQVQFLN